MDKHSINLVKLCVGAESVESHIEWQRTTRIRSDDGHRRHTTRMWPKREDELVNGGSIYWVIKGFIQFRQRIIRFDEIIDGRGIRRCGIIMEEEVIRTQTVARRPFQGWRYLTAEQAPDDLPHGRESDSQLPAEMNHALSQIGVI